MSLKPDKPPTLMQSMGKRPIPLYLGILAIWIIGGSWWYHVTCCGGVATSLTIKAGDELVAEAKGSNILFAKGEATPTLDDNVKAALIKVADYMKAHPDKRLMINGLFDKKGEANVASLGLARAASMKDLFAGWGVDTNLIVLNGNEGKLKFSNDGTYGAVNFAIEDIPNRYMKFNAGDLDINAKNNLSFPMNSAKIDQPVPADVQAGARQLADYLKAHPDQKLQIIGWYGSQEDAGSDDLNLGRARANALRDWWISMGIPSSQVVVAGAERKDDLTFINGKLYGGAEYQISGLTVDIEGGTDDQEGANAGDNTNTDGEDADNDGNDVKARGVDGDEESDEDAGSVAIPPVVNIYFDKSSDVPKIFEAESSKLAEFVSYLSKFKDKTLTIKGYASSEGSAAYNKQLGDKRGKAVKNYLVVKGVSGNQIVIDAVGAAVTTAKDDSEEERSKDRRAELTINQE